MASNHAVQADPYKTCTKVTPDCPVEATVLGYYPNLASGYFFTVAFSLCLVTTLLIGLARRTCGLILETAGYVARILLAANPWNQQAFELEVCAIIIGPTFICAAIYLTLKHLALALDPDLSRLPAPWYPRLFLPADLSCLIVQAIGGAIAAAAGHDSPALQRTGNRAIIAGVALQVVVLVVFGALGLDYLVRVARSMRRPDACDTDGFRVWRSFNFRVFAFAVCTAYLAILIRCIYRIAEMAGGWGNRIMQDQPSFLVLDSTLVLVASALLTIVHPGIFFPQMRAIARRRLGVHEKSAAAGAQRDTASAGSGNDTDEMKGSGANPQFSQDTETTARV